MNYQPFTPQLPAKTFGFSRFAASVARGSGRASCFIAASIICAMWLLTGPLVHWSDSWQLVINSVSSIITFLMVFVIQGSQTRDTDILNAKLNEILRCLPEARREFLAIDDLHGDDVHRLNEEFTRLARAELVSVGGAVRPTTLQVGRNEGGVVYRGTEAPIIGVPGNSA